MRSQQLYKKRYVIAFYKRDDDTLLYLFNNVEQVCRAAGLEVTYSNMHKISTSLYKSLRREDHHTRMLNGKLMCVHIIDVTDDDEDDMNENERSES